MNDSPYVVSADIGGTHCTAAVVNIADKAIVPSREQRVAVDADAEADMIINTWADCIQAAKGDTPIAGICLAMPGPFDYEKGISQIKDQGKYDKLFGRNVKEMLAGKLSMQVGEIYMNNDAACFLQGEVFAGAARQHQGDHVIGITLGTGLGTAFYQDGIATNADLWCMPFKQGIAEDFLSARWFRSRFRERSGKSLPGVKAIAALARTDQNARSVFEEFGEQLGAFLLEFIRLHDAHAIVIGGNIAKASDLFAGPLMSIIQHGYPQLSIHFSSLGEQAPLLGAVGGWLSRQQ